MRQEDLVYLIYSQNTCYLSLVEKPPGIAAVEINLENETYTAWWFQGGSRHRNAQKIGSGRLMQYPSPNNLIGVFDRTKLADLKAIVALTQEFDHRQGPAIDVD